MARENEQPDYPFVYVGWNVDCELSEEDEDSGQDNEKITENMSWDRDRCDHKILDRERERDVPS